MSAKLTADQVNILNIFLMLLSAGLAFVYPFELFLLVYAVLGPLHYLTEISWLHDKNYYTRGKFDFLFLAAVSVAVTGLSLGFFPGLPVSAVEFLVYLAFAGGAIFLLLEDSFKRGIAFLAAGLSGLFLLRFPFFGPLFGVFFPTIVHVFLFTGFFLLAGALKGKGFSGFLSLTVFVGAACGLIFFHPDRALYHAGQYARDSYGLFKGDGTPGGAFVILNFIIVKNFGIHDFGPPTGPLSDYLAGVNQYLYQNPLALSLMAFIAFAYTYHYLNWFSKTSIIRWHEVPRGRMVAVTVIWIGSLVLYAWNYSLGFRWLFFLSFAHVLLEFPLDHLTMINLGKEAGRRMGWSGKAETGKI